MELLEKYIEKSGIKLSSGCKSALFQHSHIHLKKGEYLLKEGVIAKNIGFIISGKIMHYYNIEGKQVTRWVSLSHTFVTAFSSFMKGVKSLENLICIENTEIILYNKDYFMNTLRSFKEFEMLWTQTLELNMIGYEYRVYQLITTNAVQRYLNFIKTYPKFEQEVPQKYIASMLGIEPRHLSRIRKQLSKKDK